MTGDEASAPQPEEAQQQPPGPRPADHEHTGALEVGAAVEMAEAAPGEAEEPPAGSRGVQQGGDDQGGDQQDAGPPPPPSTAAGAGAAELSDAGRPDEPAAPKELVAPKEEEEEFSEGRRLPAPADGAPAAAVAAQPAVQQQPAPAAPNLGNGAVQQPQEQQGLPAALASAFLHAAQHLQQQKHEPQPAPSAPRPSPPSAAEPEQRLTGMPGGEELHVSAGGGPPSLPSQQQPEGQALPRPVSSTGAGSSGKKCVECGSMDTPMWRTHPVHGRGTLCNACGVKLYRQQCKDRARSLPEPGGSYGSAGDTAWPASDEARAKRQKTVLTELAQQAQRQQLLQQQLGLGRAEQSVAALVGQLQGGAANAALAKALAGGAGVAAEPLLRQPPPADPRIPGCQFAFRGQLPDGSVEPRAIHDVTITLHTPREAGAGMTQSHLAVVDSGGGRLATYHTAELEPRLEYDQYLNMAVWDSRDGWWLLLPTPDHALAFQGMMRVLAARKLGLVDPPPLPEAAAQLNALHTVRSTAQQAVAAQHMAGPPGAATSKAAAQLPAGAAALLQQLVQAAQGTGGGTPDVHRLLGLLTQGLAGAGTPTAAGAAGTAGNGAHHQRHAGATGDGGAAAPVRGAPGPGESALPLAHQSRMEKLFAAPPHHTSAAPVPATIRVPERAGAEPHKQRPVSSGPNAFAAPASAGPSLFPGFGGAGGRGEGGGRGGSMEPSPRAAALQEQQQHHQQPSVGAAAATGEQQQQPWRPPSAVQDARAMRGGRTPPPVSGQKQGSEVETGRGFALTAQVHQQGAPAGQQQQQHAPRAWQHHTQLGRQIEGEREGANSAPPGPHGPAPQVGGPLRSVFSSQPQMQMQQPAGAAGPSPQHPAGGSTGTRQAQLPALTPETDAALHLLAALQKQHLAQQR